MPDPLAARPTETHEVRRLTRWVGLVFAACSALLVPWTAYLVWTLPDHETAANYAMAWGGFDLALVVALGVTAWSAVRLGRWLPVAATATATLLCVDGWFDVVMSPTASERCVALGMALVVELPLAAACVWLAVNGQNLHERDLFAVARRRTIERLRRTGR